MEAVDDLQDCDARSLEPQCLDHVTKKDCAAFCLPMSASTTEAVFICPWIKIRRIGVRCSRSARLLRFPKSVVCITDMNGVLPNRLRLRFDRVWILACPLCESQAKWRRKKHLMQNQVKEPAAMRSDRVQRLRIGNDDPSILKMEQTIFG
jgi:hypothetical protein